MVSRHFSAASRWLEFSAGSRELGQEDPDAGHAPVEIEAAQGRRHLLGDHHPAWPADMSSRDERAANDPVADRFGRFEPKIGARWRGPGGGAPSRRGAGLEIAGADRQLDRSHLHIDDPRVQPANAALDRPVAGFLQDVGDLPPRRRPDAARVRPAVEERDVPPSQREIFRRENVDADSIAPIILGRQRRDDVVPLLRRGAGMRMHALAQHLPIVRGRPGDVAKPGSGEARQQVRSVQEFGAMRHHRFERPAKSAREMPEIGFDILGLAA